LKNIEPPKPGQKETPYVPKKNGRGVEYVDKLSALHQHASQLGLADTIDEIAEHSLDAMKFTLGFDWAGFFRVEDGYLKFTAIRGAPVAFSGLPLDGSGITVKAANTKSTIRVPDVRKDSAYVDGKGLDWKGTPTMLSELAVPVLIDDEVAAVLNAESSKLDAFTGEDQTLLEILAFHVGSALKRLVDVAEHRRVQEALTNERNVLRTLIDTLPDNIFIKDAESRFITSNLAHARLLRAKTPDEIVGKTDFDIFPRELAASYYDDEQAVIQSGQPLLNREERTTDPEGRTRWLLTTKVPLRNDQGKIIGVAGINRDITERKRAEEALKESEQRFRAIFDGVNDGILVSDVETRKFYVGNNAICRMLGCRPEDIKNLGVVDIHPEESLSYATEQFDRLASHEIGAATEIPVKRRDGSVFYADISPSFLTLAGRTYLIGVFRDITERKRAEEALANERNVLRTLIDNLPDNIFIKDAESRFVITNLAHVHHLRAKTLDEIVGKTDFDIYPRELAASYYADEQAVIQSGQPLVNREERTIDPEGKTRWLLTTKVPLRDDHGKVIGIAGINRDITERKLAEETLRENEEKYRRLFEQATDGIALADAETGIILDCNLALAALVGRDRAELIGQHQAILHPPTNDGSTFSPTFKLHTTTHEGQMLETQVITSTGQIKEVEIKANLLYLQGRKTVQGIFHDITERKRMQDEIKRYSEHLEELVKERTENLAESEVRYRRLFESSPISLWEEDFSDVKRYFDDLRSRGIKDLRGYFMEHPEELAKCAGMAKILDVNQATLTLYGAKTVEELRGELSRVFTYDFEEKFREELVALGEGRTRFVSEFDNQTLTGDVKHVDLILSVVPGYEDTLEKVLVSIIDLTERKRIEGELRSTKERLEYVVTSNPAVIYSGKPFADLSDWQLTYLSQNVMNLLGYEAREFVGHPEFWTHVVHPMDRPSVLAQMRSLWANGRFIFEYRMRHKDGDYRWIREEANAIRDVEGKPIDVTGYWIDITELRRLEENLLNSQRLAAIGETTTMVGHDLRNPLQAMTGTLYLVKNLAASRKPEDRRKAARLLSTLDDGIEYMDKIVSDLQDYARPVGAELVETSLPDLVRATVSNVKIPGNVKVAANLGDGLSNVRLDPLLFRRVLTNLILNAVQAMPKGGKLTIKGSRGDDSITVGVQDTGVGIPQENLEKVFTPFFTTKAKGQGLGLAVCKRLTEVQGGTIEVASQLGEGSTFTLKIPTNRTPIAT
jgi:PAS domain S-box-containing protein